MLLSLHDEKDYHNKNQAIQNRERKHTDFVKNTVLHIYGSSGPA